MATYYYDPIAGSDANPGTFGSPRQTLNGGANSATTMFAAGHNVYSACGTVFRPVFGSGYLFNPGVSVHNGQIWGAYEASYGSNPPLYDSLLYDDGPTGWSDIGSGRWSKNFASTGIPAMYGRVFAGLINSTSETTRTQAMRNMGSAAACVDYLQYFMTGTTLTVYSGGVDPFTYYGGLGIGVQVFGSIVSGRFRFMDGETIQDLDFRHGGIYIGNNIYNCTFKNLRSKYSLNGTFLSLVESNTTGCRNINIYNCSYDAMTSASEWEDVAGFGAWNFIGGQTTTTGAVATNEMRNIDIVDCSGRGAGHALINIQAQTATTPYLESVTGVRIRATQLGRSVWSNGDVQTGRTFNLGVAGFVIDRVICEGQQRQDQFAGSGVITRSIWRDGVRATITTRRDIDHFLSVTPPNYNGVRQFASGSIDIHGNVFSNPSGYVLEYDSQPASVRPGVVNEVRFFNNVVVDQTYYNSRRIEESSVVYAAPSASLLFRAQSYLDHPITATVFNNIFVLPVGATDIMAHNNNDTGVVQYAVSGSKNILQTYGINAGPSVPGGLVTPYGNALYSSLSAAGLSTDYKGTTASPGYRAATHGGYLPDAAGSVRWNPPTRGAYEVA